MTPDSTKHRTRVALAAGTLAVILAGCGSSSTSTASLETVAGQTVAEQGGGVGFADRSTAGGATAAAAAATTVPGAGKVTAVADPTPVDRKVIVTVTLDLLVDDVGASGVKVATMVEGVGGYVFSQQTNLGERPSSSIVLKVPPAKVASLLGTLGSVGKVTAQTQQAEDVTAQFVDLESRITAARASVGRVREFLDRTTTVGELAGLEAELTRRQTELEQLLGQQRVLASQTDLATVTVTLSPAPVAAAAAGRPSVSRALHRGIDSVINVGGALAMVAAFALPWLPVLLVIGGVLVWRRRRNRIVVGDAPTPPAATPEREKIDA